MKKWLLFLIVFLANTTQAQNVIQYNVPFVSQAPNGNWRDKIFADACEETSLIMAYAWVMGEPLEVRNAMHKIHAIAAWEKNRFGFHQDTSVFDTYVIATEYLHLPAQYQSNITVDDVLTALQEKNLVVAPINASKLYRGGPPRHMILVSGFDYSVNEFIYSDPMKKNGANLRISRDVLQSILRDYPSGVHKTVRTQTTAMIKIPWPWIDNPS